MYCRPALQQQRIQTIKHCRTSTSSRKIIERVFPESINDHKMLIIFYILHNLQVNPSMQIFENLPLTWKPLGKNRLLSFFLFMRLFSFLLHLCSSLKAGQGLFDNTCNQREIRFRRRKCKSKTQNWKITWNKNKLNNWSK